MKPGDHPDFFRFAPPPGTSRESTIVLDREGSFWHDGVRVEHGALEEALHRWISKHPDDGRLILTNGYDWCYFRAEGTPYIVRALRVADDGRSAELVLSDATDEPLDPRNLCIGDEGVVFARVKGGSFEARFSRHAQTALAPLLVSAEPPVVKVGDVQAELGFRAVQ
ncbi:MAG: hypothetical protein IPM54_37265 [Polyangiaceae bacterium]|nr:hypothetical protein [Polyangiaceae bacterium]